MYSRMVAVADYILAASAALGAESPVVVVQLRLQHTDELKTLIARGVDCVSEAATVLKALANTADGPLAEAFTQEQKKELAAAVAQNCKSICLQEATSKSITQEHFHIQNYFTRADWDTLGSSTTPMDVKIATTVARLLEIGCPNPSERSVAAIASVLASAAGCGSTAHESHELIKWLKRVLKFQRQKTPVPQTTRTFPENVAVFLTAHPEAYSASSPPVASCLSELVIQLKRSSMPVRVTHKALQNPSPSSASSSSSSDMLAAMAHMFMQHMQPSPGRRPEVTLLSPSRHSPVPEPPWSRALAVPPPLLALTAGEAADSGEGASPAPKTSSIDEMLKSIQEQMNEKAEAKKQEKKAAKFEAGIEEPKKKVRPKAKAKSPTKNQPHQRTLLHQ